MPTYQYACTSCGERLEAVQKFSDDPLTVCPACSGALRKVFSPVGVVFKGSGFYKTDSRSSGSKTGSSAAARSGDSAPSTGGTDSGTGSAASATPKESPAPAASGGSSTTGGTGGAGGSAGDRVA